ncbi:MULTISPECIES: hypothetical protein [unclassified Pseudomonas]|uniref:hypothetical protein n=1 Tax=unclassified Pseudomonas TaxID=196821 RepID=UPI0002A24203|nr:MULTISPECIES: hypothetical protein [unclassified Pseudomonas]MBB1610536.1 hypothetical protein [Pseudomonas sp. UMC76]MBB1640378.1 hypothetical protein [Pseudomonas sp. UME83]NTX91236.1 hypothetical protein [Pseudomonas sp. UMA643]NTY17827.1 hypothetical protein [Pseudomonas sp. UMC3103]NTY24746.1 hypothetical protein [Pseudomonas sp. UMA603]
MSDFLSRLEAKRKKNSTTESMTIRVSAEEDAAIKELANYYECTRQDLIHELITEYLMPAWQALQRDPVSVADYSTQEGKRAFYVLNTNKANMAADHDFMLAEGVAAAFEDGYKEKIERFKKGDVIFLYESGVGIVAFGEASGETLKKEHLGRPDKTYYQKLDRFERLDEPLAPKGITRVLSRSIKFVQTLTGLPDGDVLLKAVKKA